MMKDSCEKWTVKLGVVKLEGKTNFSRRLKQFDSLTRLTLRA